MNKNSKKKKEKKKKNESKKRVESGYFCYCNYAIVPTVGSKMILSYYFMIYLAFNRNVQNQRAGLK